MPSPGSLQVAAVVISALNLIAVVVGLYIVVRELASTHDWNRRRCTHDLLSELLKGRFATIRREIEKKIDPFNTSQTYSTVRALLDEDDRAKLKDLLNSLEEMCLSIKHGIVDDDIAYECCASILIHYDRWAGPYRAEITTAATPNVWIELGARAAEWAKKRDGEQSARVRPGLPKLGRVTAGR